MQRSSEEFLSLLAGWSGGPARVQVSATFDEACGVGAAVRMIGRVEVDFVGAKLVVRAEDGGSFQCGIPASGFAHLTSAEVEAELPEMAGELSEDLSRVEEVGIIRQAGATVLLFLLRE